MKKYKGITLEMKQENLKQNKEQTHKNSKL